MKIFSCNHTLYNHRNTVNVLIGTITGFSLKVKIKIKDKLDAYNAKERLQSRYILIGQSSLGLDVLINHFDDIRVKIRSPCSIYVVLFTMLKDSLDLNFSNPFIRSYSLFKSRLDSNPVAP